MEIILLEEFKKYFCLITFAIVRSPLQAIYIPLMHMSSYAFIWHSNLDCIPMVPWWIFF